MNHVNSCYLCFIGNDWDHCLLRIFTYIEHFLYLTHTLFTVTYILHIVHYIFYHSIYLLCAIWSTIGAAEDRCAIAGDGKELEIGFNVRYLADALRAIPSEEVVLELTNGLSPIVLTPAEEKYDYSYMVLPVRIKNG